MQLQPYKILRFAMATYVCLSICLFPTCNQKSISTISRDPTVDTDGDGVADIYDEYPYDWSRAGDPDKDGVDSIDDVDDDNDGLIEVRTAIELAKMRDDLNADGYDDGNFEGDAENAVEAFGVEGAPTGAVPLCDRGTPNPIDEDVETFICGYELIANIDASAFDPWIPIGICDGDCTAGDNDRFYTGLLEGNGFSITNVKVDNSVTYGVSFFTGFNPNDAEAVLGVGLFSGLSATTRLYNFTVLFAFKGSRVTALHPHHHHQRCHP